MVTQHHGCDRDQRCVGLVAFLHGAAHVDAIAGRQLRLDFFQRRPNGLGHRHALFAILHIGANGDGHVAIAAPEDWLFELGLDACDLG